MPPSANTRSAQKEQLEQDGQADQQRPDLFADDVLMYPVFCTVNIPPEVKLSVFTRVSIRVC
jgi:hypothetical protein